MARPKKAVKSKKKPVAKKVKMLKKKIAKKLKIKPKAKKVSAIPKGYNSVIPYLTINADAEKAMQFYKKVFGAKEMMRMEHNGKIGHAELKIGDTKVMLADASCGKPNEDHPNHSVGTSVTIHLYVKNADDVVDRAVAAGAKLLNPVEDRFYGDRNGMIQDPYGFYWCVSSRVMNLSPAKMRKRAVEFYKEANR